MKTLSIELRFFQFIDWFNIQSDPIYIHFNFTDETETINFHRYLSRNEFIFRIFIGREI
jgi:hypothetical protein